MKRDETRSQVRRDIIGIYDQRRRKKLRILSVLEDKACSGCRVRVPAQRYSDICRHVDIFLCDNCGSYLAPPISSDDDAG